MALLDHFTRNAGTELGENGFPRYPGHQFVADMILFLIGGPPANGGILRAKIVNDFNLTADDQIQLDEMKAVYDGLNVANRNIYRDQVTSVFSLLQLELMTKANASLILGITNA